MGGAETLGCLERPTPGDALVALRGEAEADQDVRGGLDVFLRHHDVDVDDRLGGQAGDGRAADVLDGDHGYAGGLQCLAVLLAERLEAIRPRGVVVDDLDHGWTLTEPHSAWLRLFGAFVRFVR